MDDHIAHASLMDVEERTGLGGGESADYGCQYPREAVARRNRKRD